MGLRRWLGFAEGSGEATGPRIAPVSAWLYEDRDDWTADRIQERRQALEHQILDRQARREFIPDHLLAELRWCDSELAFCHDQADERRQPAAVRAAGAPTVVPLDAAPAPDDPSTAPYADLAAEVAALQDEQLAQYVTLLERMAADLAQGHYDKDHEDAEAILSGALSAHPEYPYALSSQVMKGMRLVDERERLLRTRAEARLAPMKAELRLAAGAAREAETALRQNDSRGPQAESTLVALRQLLARASDLYCGIVDTELIPYSFERLVTDVRHRADSLERALRDAPTVGEPAVIAPVEANLAFARMEPGEFEEAIAALLRRAGHHAVERSGGAGDLGADVTAVTALGSKIVVQCKRYDVRRAVGSPDIQRFGGTCFAVHHADLPLFVTTSSFTAAAQALAEKLGIVTIDGEELERWQAGDHNPAEGL